jgi:hypothetical protein
MTYGAVRMHGEIRKGYILIRKCEWMRPRHKWEGNITAYIKDIDCDEVEGSAVPG